MTSQPTIAANFQPATTPMTTAPTAPAPAPTSRCPVVELAVGGERPPVGGLAGGRVSRVATYRQYRRFATSRPLDFAFRATFPRAHGKGEATGDRSSGVGETIRFASRG